MLVVFPDLRYIQHFKLPVNGILKKIKEFNLQLAQIGELHGIETLSTAELLHLEKLITTFGNEETVMQPIDIESVQLLQKLIIWPIQCVYPILDIMKNCILRPNGLLVLTEAPHFNIHSFVESLQYALCCVLIIVLEKLPAQCLSCSSAYWLIFYVFEVVNGL